MILRAPSAPWALMQAQQIAIAHSLHYFKTIVILESNVVGMFTWLDMYTITWTTLDVMTRKRVADVYGVPC